MNPPNPFGSLQGGAFQAPNNAGLFQTFGQQSPSNQSQTMGFFQPSAFGQPSVLSQSSSHGNTVFGQAPAFGQSSAQPPSLPAISQTPAFGQTSLGMNSSSFGSSPTPAFGQTSASNQGSVFGQTPAFGQSPAFGQTPGFGQQTSAFSKQPAGFGQQPPRFGNPQMASVAITTLGQPQPLAFGQPAFGQPPSTSATTSVFGASQSITQGRAFGSSEFSFKPANEALFKPIFSASPEPANPQATPLSSSPFGSKGSSSAMSSTSTTTGVSLLTSAKSGPLGFSFSQPAAAPSISAQTNPLTTASSSTATNTLQFTFSQPASVSSSSTKPSTTQPTTPSSFSFSAKTLQPQTAQFFGGSNFGQPCKPETNTDEKASDLENLQDTNIFARFTKAAKHREEPEMSASVQEKPATGDDVPVETDSPRLPPKRPLMRSHGPTAGLFSRALSGLRRDGTKPVKRESTKETQQQPLNEKEVEEEVVQTQRDNSPVNPEALKADELEKAEGSDSAKAPGPNLETLTPVRRGLRSESSESLGGMSPTDSTIIYCRNVPPALNKKDVIEKHFARFGKVCKVFCRPAKNQATVHFSDHASAAKAKKKGKLLHRHELLLLWQRKKQSPGEKGNRPPAEVEEAVGESQEDTDSKAASSPLRKPPFRGPAVSSMVTLSRSSPVKTSSLAKSLQFDIEPQTEGSTETQSSERPVPSSLLHMIGLVAENTEDKYRLLEQRDKILRQGRPKRTDLNLSKVFVGTCPDMCPEKERYMRETRKQLSTFEVIPDTEMVDHTAAIKEYSRSSADQEEPLPHELRPLPVLGMTMDYLVTQIMDQGQDNYRDWYDFVWNRTRGIRKDIIQQHLCCPRTVALIEKCTRFHVHCAHHLCEEHMSSFDAKINNENMTKCLQSLKEMYQDLATRQIFCPQEAEFRQYSVLLKLNDGDILREVQQFRDEVRKSPEVKFAVQVFAAVNSNNFVRFFKLVKGASYLASCLLHRYFNQVRARALKILNVAHTVGPRSTVFPIEDVVRMVMFHNGAEAIDFTQQYGLNVSDGMVELSRVAYQEPELPLSQKKSDVILGKKTVLIGEVVNGGPLPNPPQHTPVCSFDSHNKYCGEVPQAEPTPTIAAKVELKAPPNIELLPQPMASGFGLCPPLAETGEPCDDALAFHIPEPEKQPAKPQLLYSDEDIIAELDCIIDEVVKAEVRKVADAGSSYVTTALRESSLQVESLLEEVLGQMVQEVSFTEIKLEQERVAEERRKLEEARRRQEHEAFVAQFSLCLCTEIIHEVVDETIKEAATAEIKQAVNEKAECVAKCTEQVCTGLVEETLNADISLLVEEILDAELQCIHKYIKRWRDVVAVRRQLKRQMRGFPAAPCCVDPCFKLKALAPSAPAKPSIADLTRGLVNLGNAGTLALSSTRLLKMRREAMHQMRVHYYFQQLLEETVWKPLDLPALVTENMPDPPERIFWKAALLLPSYHECVASLADRILSDWLEVKMGGDTAPEVREEKQDGMLQTLCVISALQEMEEQTHKVHITIKASRGPLTEHSLSRIEESCELNGTGALLMLLPSLPVIESEQDVPLLSALLQLKQLQQANTWHSPLPLVLLVPGADSGAADVMKLEQALMLQTLVKEGVISEYTFFFVPESISDLQGSKQLNQAVRWLLARAPPPSTLSCQTLVQLIEARLSREFSSRVYSHRQERAAACLPYQDPAPVVQLYNSVLAHVADRVSSQDLCRLSWPPGEFCVADTRAFVPPLGWNSTQHLDWLRKAILSLQLPQWEQMSSTEWTEVCSTIFQYAAQIPVSRLSQPLLMSRLENLLERVRLKAHCDRTHRSKVSSGDLNNEDRVLPSYRQIPWDDLLMICIDHKLKDWQIPEPPVCEDAVTENGKILVYFPPGTLTGFQPPEQWVQALRQTHMEKQQDKQHANGACCVAPSGQSLRQRLFPPLVEALMAPEAPLDITHTPTAQELLAHRVLQRLEEEKAESKRSIEQLQCWFNADPLEQLSSPLFIPSSTLLSMPSAVRCHSAAKTRDATPAQPVHLSEETAPVSMTSRIKELERQILVSQEEEEACRLKLSGLLSIVDD